MASHEIQPVGDDPVFVDRTGRRRRRLVLCGRLGVAALAAATAVTVAGLAGGARLPSLALPAPLNPAAPRTTTHPTTREAQPPASRIPGREAVTVSTPVLETAAVRPAKAPTTAVTSASPSRPAVVPSPPSPSAGDAGTPEPSTSSAAAPATGRKPKACTAPGRKPPRAAAACRARSGHKK
ncbi:hypothetical protein AB0368_03395 [Actinoplanes sp. NPDC051475]|uniref:hypothetical protein n=1 Tax=Actinoplanes sp. NPDC051475 TaxID=3157225 RepID=UPI00344F60D5